MLDDTNKRKLKWGLPLLASVILPAIFFAMTLMQNHSIENELSKVAWGTLSMPNEGAIILSECAKKACVATKAADLAAKIEVERQAQLAAQVQASSEQPSSGYVSVALSGTQNRPSSSGSSNSTSQQAETVLVVLPPLYCRDGTSGYDNNLNATQCEGHGGVCNDAWGIDMGCSN